MKLFFLEPGSALAIAFAGLLTCHGQAPMVAASLEGALPAAVTGAPQVKPPVYRIYALRNGLCKIAGPHAFHGGNSAETYDYALYLWLILGGDKPILVDAGLTRVEEMNRGAAHVLYEPIRQDPREHSLAQLRKFGLTPGDIGHVFITHLHFDHVDDLLQYTNARVYFGRKEWEKATSIANSWADGRTMQAFLNDPACQRRLVLVEDQEVLPGLESFWIGGHTPGSMAYRVNTAHGKAVLTGDTISLLANVDRKTPPGVYHDLEECRAALQKVREKADIVLPSHDPGTLERWPPRPPNVPRYTIRAIKVGECDVRDYITFQDSESQTTSLFYLYLWVIEGGPKPIVVETGPKYPEEFSKGTAQYIPGGVRQRPEERTVAALRRHGIDPAQVSHVIATHLHADHYDYFDAFPNARFVVNRREYEEASGGAGDKDRLARDVRQALTQRANALQLVEDEEVAPGVRVFPLGCHTSGSQGVLVRSPLGPVVLTGDVVYKYENIERNRPTRSPSPPACLDAMTKIRALADLVLPAHDPLTLERWPGGIIGLSEAPPAASPSAPSRPHLADYDAEPRRPDGRVDIDMLVTRLKELGVTTYYWLIWHAPTDWEDLKLFLPQAQKAGIDVWVYLVPPSESPPQYGGQYSEPFRLDYPRWAEEIARLSLEHTNLTGWVIDDFYANHPFFTPAYLRGMQARAKRLNPRLPFLPLMYFDEIRPKFVEDYKEVIEGVVVAYLQDREEIERTWAILNDAEVTAPGEFSHPWNTPSRAGAFVMASQSVKVLPAQGPRLHFRERDDFTGPTAGYHFKQLLVDGAVAWEDDVAGGTPAWRELTVDLAQQTRGKTNVTLAFRLIDKKGVSNFGVRWRVSSLRAGGLEVAADLSQPQKWQVSRQGAFETGFGGEAKTGQRRFHVPFISMTAADAGEFRLRHGDPATPQRIAGQLRLSLQAWREGKCDGVVTYCLDKRPASQTFPLARALFTSPGTPPQR
jgi:glyoxylase-like metal-dependent hydrolase (beta-lactamase superfamily II)